MIAIRHPTAAYSPNKRNTEKSKLCYMPSSTGRGMTRTKRCGRRRPDAPSPFLPHHIHPALAAKSAAASSFVSEGSPTRGHPFLAREGESGRSSVPFATATVRDSARRVDLL